MAFELKYSSTIWSPTRMPIIGSSTRRFDAGIFAESNQDLAVQWANRVSAARSKYTYAFNLTSAEADSLEAFFSSFGLLVFQFREGAPGEACAEITSYRNVTFADEGYVFDRKRIAGEVVLVNSTIILQDAV